MFTLVHDDVRAEVEQLDRQYRELGLRAAAARQSRSTRRRRMPPPASRRAASSSSGTAAHGRTNTTCSSGPIRTIFSRCCLDHRARARAESTTHVPELHGARISSGDDVLLAGRVANDGQPEQERRPLVVHDRRHGAAASSTARPAPATSSSTDWTELSPERSGRLFPIRRPAGRSGCGT